MLDNYFMPAMYEPDEHEELLAKIEASLTFFEGNDFEAALENACYMCGADVDDLDEEDKERLSRTFDK